MLWFILSLLTALSKSLGDVFSKKSLKDVNEYAVAWGMRFFGFLFLLPYVFLVGIPPIEEGFWMALFFVASLNFITTILYMKALKASDLSITVPILTCTPVFVLVTSPLIVGASELPSLTGLAGVLLIVAGAYTLNIKEKHKGFLEPFRALLKERGPKLMLAVAVIWSVTASLDKVGVLSSSPIFWAIAVDFLIAILIFPILWYKSRAREVLPNLKALVPIGLFLALMSIFQMTAISMALVAYVISIKRTSALIGVVLGYLIFKEKGVRERLAGAAIMVAGVALIALS